MARRLAANALAVLAATAVLTLVVGPLLGRFRVLTVRSGSMTPAVPVGAVVIVTPAPRSTVHPGDVITFEPPDAPGTLRTHRVVDVVAPGDQPLIRTQGDANPTADPGPFRLTRGPAWKVAGVVPGLGWALVWLRSPAVHDALVLLAPLVLLLLWLHAIWFDEPDRPDPTVVPAHAPPA